VNKSPLKLAKVQLTKVRNAGGNRPPGVSPGSMLLRAIKPDSLRHLFFSPRNVMNGAYAGRHASTLRGASPEFIEHRAYTEGDPLSLIDWRAFARSDRFYVRLTQHETDAACHVLIDSSASMNFAGCFPGRAPGEPVNSKFSVATRLAASLMYLLIGQGDRAGCSLFTNRILWNQPAVGTPARLQSIFAQLEIHPAEGQTDIDAVLKEASALISGRSIVVIISDFYTEPEKLFRSLGPFLHRRADLILFHLLHPHERTLPNLGPARLKDMESDARLSCSLGELRERHEAIMQAHIDQLRQGSRARGIDYNLISTDQSVHQALQHYLARRGGFRR